MRFSDSGWYIPALNFRIVAAQRLGLATSGAMDGGGTD